MTQTKTYEITASNPRKSSCSESPGATDLDVLVLWSDGERWDGEITLLPEHGDHGHLVSWGQPDHWIDGRLVNRMRKLDDSTFRDMCHDLVAAAAEVA
jgi:hypothetical protein